MAALLRFTCAAMASWGNGLYHFCEADENKFTKTPPDSEQPRSFVQLLGPSMGGVRGGVARVAGKPSGKPYFAMVMPRVSSQLCSVVVPFTRINDGVPHGNIWCTSTIDGPTKCLGYLHLCLMSAFWSISAIAKLGSSLRSS